MDNRFECEVCLQKYNSEDRIPKFLNCFHTFCLSCLQYRVINNSVHCPTCSNGTPLNSLPLEKALQTNPYILIQMEKSGYVAAATNSKPAANVGIPKKRCYWCSTCTLTVEEGENCVKNHTVHDLETEDGREIAEIFLKTLFVTCKKQWNSALVKNQETVSALKSVQAALQVLQDWAGTQRKEAERQTKVLQKNLFEVGHLLKPQADKQFTGEEIHNLFVKYKELVAEIKAEQTSPNTFDSLRNATVAMEIKAADGKQIAAPLFNSATLNFPSKRDEEQESHLLTALSFLILTGSHSGNWMAPVTPKKPKEGKVAAQATPLEKGKTKAPKNEQKPGADEGVNKPKLEKKKATNTDQNQASHKKSIESKVPPNIGTKPKSLPQTHADTPRPNHPNKSKPPSSKAFERREPINQPSSLPQVPSDLLKGVSQLNLSGASPSAISPSVSSLHNKKAFLALAINGKQYGTIVIELRPDVAPIMCQRFAQNCLATGAMGYQGTTIYKTIPKMFVMGGKLPGPEELYIADASPLKKTRGAVFLRVKRDYTKMLCSIVSSEFCVHLSEENPDKFRTSTVFGFVVDGLAVWDAISHMDCSKDHIAIASAGLAG